MSDERIRLPELDRTEPVRDWSTMFTASHGNGHSAPSDRGVAPEPGTNEHGPERDVAMGYRVIDEYMRIGATAARNLAQASWDPSSANQMFDRLLEATSDLGSVWIEMMQALWSTQARERTKPEDAGPFELREAPQSTPQPSAVMETPAVRQPVAVAFHVRGGRDVEVSAELTARPGHRAWLVHDLRARASSVPRIANVAFAYDAGLSRAVISLQIPADQPPGVYSGLIVDDETNLPCGTVCVRLA